MTDICPGDCAFLVKTRVDTESHTGEFWYCGSLDRVINRHTPDGELLPDCVCKWCRYMIKRNAE